MASVELPGSKFIRSGGGFFSGGFSFGSSSGVGLDVFDKGSL